LGVTSFAQTMGSHQSKARDLEFRTLLLMCALVFSIVVILIALFAGRFRVAGICIASVIAIAALWRFTA